MSKPKTSRTRSPKKTPTPKPIPIPPPEPAPVIAAPPPVPVAPPAPPPVPPVSGRAAVDWVAAGKKAWETRQRNLAARAAGVTSPVTPPLPNPYPADEQAIAARPGERLVVRSDSSADRYRARVLAAMRRTTKTPTTSYIGRDAGDGWAIVGTDGTRALLEHPATPPAEKTARPLVTRLPYSVALTPALEHAIRTLDRVSRKDHCSVALTFDKKTQRVTLRHASGVDAPVLPPVPLTGTIGTRTILLDITRLADGLGRGGALHYGGPMDIVQIVTPDGFRYVQMPMRPPVEVR